MTSALSRSVAFSLLAGPILTFSAPAAGASSQQIDDSLVNCVEAARALAGAEYHEVNRRVQQNASVFEYWVSNAEDRAAPRVYCRINIRLGEVEQIAMLPAGAYRP